VEVPAGSFHAWRVHYVDTSDVDVGVPEASGTLWVARGVGLVREKHVAGESRVVLELVELADPT
jgi:hypothetical protein